MGGRVECCDLCPLSQVCNGVNMRVWVAKKLCGSVCVVRWYVSAAVNSIFIHLPDHILVHTSVRENAEKRERVGERKREKICVWYVVICVCVLWARMERVSIPV